jgi:hypothetical protein
MFSWCILPLIFNDLKKLNNNESMDVSTLAQGRNKKGGHEKYIQSLLKFKIKNPDGSMKSDGTLKFDNHCTLVWLNDENYNLLQNVPIDSSDKNTDLLDVFIKCLFTYRKGTVEGLPDKDPKKPGSKNLNPLLFSNKNEKDSVLNRVIFEHTDKKKSMTFGMLCNPSRTNKILVLRFIVEIFLGLIKSSEWESTEPHDDDELKDTPSLCERYRKWFYILMPVLDVSKDGYDIKDFTVLSDLEKCVYSYQLFFSNEKLSPTNTYKPNEFEVFGALVSKMSNNDVSEEVQEFDNVDDDDIQSYQGFFQEVEEETSAPTQSFDSSQVESQQVDVKPSKVHTKKRKEISSGDSDIEKQSIKKSKKHKHE